MYLLFQKLHVHIYTRTFRFLDYPSIFFSSILCVNHVSAHRHSTTFANHVFPSTATQTNGHLGARPTRIENATKFNKQQAIRQTIRVEFTLMKLQEEYPENGARGQITQVHKIIKPAEETAK